MLVGEAVIMSVSDSRVEVLVPEVDLDTEGAEYELSDCGDGGMTKVCCAFFLVFWLESECGVMLGSSIIDPRSSGLPLRLGFLLVFRLPTRRNTCPPKLTTSIFVVFRSIISAGTPIDERSFRRPAGVYGDKDGGVQDNAVLHVPDGDRTRSGENIILRGIFFGLLADANGIAS